MRDRTLVLVFAFSLIAFALVWLSVFVTGWSLASDAQLSLWVNAQNPGGLLSSLLVAAAVYGREYFWGLVVLLMLLFGDKQTRILAVELGGLFLIGIAAGDVLKAIIYRPRPPLALSEIIPRISLDPDSSFPSGHALIVSLGAAFSLLTFRRRWFAVLLTAEAAAVFYARVFVGVHYVTDVVAGAAIGVSIASMGLVLERKFLEKPLSKVLGRAKTEGHA